MDSPATRKALSPGRGRLLETCQQLNFGRIEQLVIRGGEPVFDPPPRIVREVKFGAENGPRPESEAGDFQLKAQMVDLFAELDRLEDGIIAVLEVKHGLPFRMIVEDGMA